MGAIRRVQKKRDWARQSGKKRKFIRGKREGDWLLRRISVFPFWWSLSCTPPIKNSLKGWSRSRRSGIWWPRSFEKIGASEIAGWLVVNLVSPTDHYDLFFVCEVDITSHLINEIPAGPYHYQFWIQVYINDIFKHTLLNCTVFHRYWMLPW